MTKAIPNLKKSATTESKPLDFPYTGYVRVKQIVSPLGPLPISRSGFWAGVKCGRFPKPRKISSRVTVWRAEDIRDLLTKIDSGAL